jgi:hypothetical protein
MRYRWLLPFVILALAFIAGCSEDSSNQSDGESSAKETETVRVPDPVPFSFNQDSVTKATIYVGSDKLIAEITDSNNLNMLASILDDAPSFSGDATADWNNTIVLESRDGNKRELDVTGNGYVFIDQTTKIAYELDKQRFLDFVEQFQVEEKVKSQN